MTDRAWDSAAYRKHAGFVSECGEAVVTVLAPHPGERILDLGCGEGRLAADLAARGVSVVGVDRSGAMAAAARARGVPVCVMDGAALGFDRCFDAVFSNAALHWMLDPDRVLGEVFRSLRPGGRFVGEMGGTGNVARIRNALEAVRGEMAAAGGAAAPSPSAPWFFPSAQDYRQRLERAGFLVKEITLFDRPTRLPTGIAGWIEVFGATFTAGLDPAGRAALIAGVEERVAAALRDRDGGWWADYVRLRFHAVRPAL